MISKKQWEAVLSNVSLMPEPAPKITKWVRVTKKQQSALKVKK